MLELWDTLRTKVVTRPSGAYRKQNIRSQLATECFPPSPSALISPFLTPFLSPLPQLSTLSDPRDSQPWAATSDPTNEKEATKEKASFIRTVDKC